MTMPSLLQINITANWGSHGRIAEQIGNLVMQEGCDSYIAYGRWANQSRSHLIRIGSMLDERLHAVETRLFDNHGLASGGATRSLIKKIESVNPDIIHLHNIHGYYLNYPILFQFLKSFGHPVVWTFHDCWPLTGHCSHFMFSGCEKWKTGCHGCEEKREYPSSVFLDRSSRNYRLKKECFTSLENLTLVPVSHWLESVIKESFLSSFPIRCINNGIDVNQFRIIERAKEKIGAGDKKIVLAVASRWTGRKGFDDICRLRGKLDNRFRIIMVGVSEAQKQVLPEGITGITRTNSIEELALYYSAADVFINPTYEDSFPTTNIEALACGTPVVTYKTGGSPEIIDSSTGIVVPCGDLDALGNAVGAICFTWRKDDCQAMCRNRVLQNFRQEDRYLEYYLLYKSLL